MKVKDFFLHILVFVLAVGIVSEAVIWISEYSMILLNVVFAIILIAIITISFVIDKNEDNA